MWTIKTKGKPDSWSIMGDMLDATDGVRLELEDKGETTEEEEEEAVEEEEEEAAEADRRYKQLLPPPSSKTRGKNRNTRDAK